jgi:hypothetical protein
MKSNVSNLRAVDLNALSTIPRSRHNSLPQNFRLSYKGIFQLICHQYPSESRDATSYSATKNIIFWKWSMGLKNSGAVWIACSTSSGIRNDQNAEESRHAHSLVCLATSRHDSLPSILQNHEYKGNLQVVQRISLLLRQKAERNFVIIVYHDQSERVPTAPKHPHK